MGKRAHCEVFRRHSDVPPFFSKDPSQPSPEDSSQPCLQREGVVNRQIPPANISPLLRGVRRGLKSLPSRGELEGSNIKLLG